MGLSGSGKTTLLNAIARRNSGTKLDVMGSVNVHGSTISDTELQSISS